LWKHAEVRVFGSFSTSITLPTSDIDVMIYNAGHPDKPYPDPLEELHDELVYHRHLHSKIQLVSQARVPIIKMWSALRTGEVKVDINIAISNAEPSSSAIAKFLQDMPVLRPLLLTLKYFLFQFKLHDTYTGGVGSFALAIMAVSLLQLRTAAKSNNVTRYFGMGIKDSKFFSRFEGSDDLGSLLASFFLLYGKLFDYRNCGISVRDGGRYFKKGEKLWDDISNPMGLCLEDPTDLENNVGRSSFNIPIIKGVFHNAFMRLTLEDNDFSTRFPSISNDTILSRILTVDEEILRIRSRAGDLVAGLVQEESTNKEENPNSTTPPKKPITKTPPKRKWDF